MFDGKTYQEEFDFFRLSGQLQRVLLVMRDGHWRTLEEIKCLTGDSRDASVSARLRDLRKPKFGGFKVERRSRADRCRGLFEYRLTT